MPGLAKPGADRAADRTRAVDHIARSPRDATKRADRVDAGSSSLVAVTAVGSRAQP
jgi:hypothetical protein